MWTIKDPPKVDTFQLPNEEDIASIVSGSCIKLIFANEHNAERMWVKVISITGKYWKGTMENNAVFLPIKYGQLIIFKPEQIINIWMELDEKGE